MSVRDVVLRLEGVVKRYGSRSPVLRDIDLAVPPGQATGILGANGSGKSTLLRIAAGVSRPTAGTVSGRPTRAYLPDRFSARQRMSARAYLCHMGRIRGMALLDARTRTDELLDRLALTGGPNASLRELSKGNAQKVGVAQAFLGRPELIVLDEPWSGLDPAARAVLSDMIAESLAEGVGVLFTDHRYDYVQTLATHPLRLVDGALHPLGPPDGEVRPTTRVVLRKPDNGAAVVWSEQPGVVETSNCGHRVEIVVRVPEREALLLTAIQRGWSVLAVDETVDAKEWPD